MKLIALSSYVSMYNNPNIISFKEEGGIILKKKHFGWIGAAIVFPTLFIGPYYLEQWHIAFFMGLGLGVTSAGFLVRYLVEEKNDNTDKHIS